MKAFCVDEEEDFISKKLKNICKKKDITIKYVTSYMHQENGFMKQGWKIIVIIKDLLLVNNGLPIEFWAEAMDTTNYLRNRLPTKS